MSVEVHIPTAILPDPKYDSLLLAKFINMVMERGKKSVAERIVYGALDPSRRRPARTEPLDAVRRGARQRQADGRSEVAAASAARPTRCRSKFARRAADAGDALAHRSGAQARREVDGAALAGELLEPRERGAAVKKREDTHRMAEANKAFAHYRW